MHKGEKSRFDGNTRHHRIVSEHIRTPSASVLKKSSIATDGERGEFKSNRFVRDGLWDRLATVFSSPVFHSCENVSLVGNRRGILTAAVADSSGAASSCTLEALATSSSVSSVIGSAAGTFPEAASGSA